MPRRRMMSDLQIRRLAAEIRRVSARSGPWDAGALLLRRITRALLADGLRMGIQDLERLYCAPFQPGGAVPHGGRVPPQSHNER